MAKIIATAGVRLQADEKGLAASVSRVVKKAMRDAMADVDPTPIPGLGDGQASRDADREAKGIGKIFGDLFSGIGRAGSAAMSAAFSGSRLLLMGAAAGAALSGVTALSASLVALVGAAAQAGGAVGILPAVFAAVKAVTTTLQLGLVGVKESFSALASGDVEAFNKSLEQLSPNARGFLIAAQEFAPAFKGMQLEVQDRLFENLGGTVSELGTKVLPIARNLFTELASRINNTAREVGGFLASTPALQRFTATSGNISIAFEAVRQAAVPATSAILALVEGGSTQLGRLGTAVASVTTRFSSFINQAADSGKLESFFSNSLDVASQLGRIIGNLGSGLGQVFAEGSAAGRGLLNTLEKATQQFEDFTKSASGSLAIRQFFDSIAIVGEQLGPIIQTVATAFGSGLAPILASLAQGVGPGVLSLVEQLLPALQAMQPGAAALGVAFGQVLTAISPLLPALGQLAGQIASALAQALTAALPLITSLIERISANPALFAGLAAGAFALFQAIGPIIGAVTTLLPIINTLGPVVGKLLTNVGGLRGVMSALLGPVGLAIGLFVALFAGSESFRNAVMGLLTTVGQLVGQLLAALMPAIDAILAAIQPLIVQIGDALAPVIQLITDMLATLLPPVIAALVPIINSLIPVFNQVVEVLSLVISAIVPIINIIINALIPIIENLLPVVETVFGAVAEIITAAMKVVQGIIDVVLGIITGDWSRVWSGLGDILSGALDLILSVIRGVFNTIVSVFVGIWNSLVSIVTGAWNGIVSAVSSGIRSVVDFFSNLGSSILSALGNFGSLLLSAGGDLINGLLNGVKAVAGKIKDAVLGPIKDSVDAVKNFLGISSPSRLFRQIGEFSGEGLVIGFKALTPQILAASLGMGDALASGIGTPGVGLGALSAGGGATGALAGGPAVINVQQTNIARAGTDMQQFANQVNRNNSYDLANAGSLLGVSRAPVQAGMAAPDTFFGGS